MPATPSSHTLAQDSQATDVLTSDSMRHSIHLSSRTLPMLKLADIFSVSVLLFKLKQISMYSVHFIYFSSCVAPNRSPLPLQK